MHYNAHSVFGLIIIQIKTLGNIILIIDSSGGGFSGCSWGVRKVKSETTISVNCIACGLDLLSL